VVSPGVRGLHTAALLAALLAGLLAAGPAAAGVVLHGEVTAGGRLYPEAASVGRDVEWLLGGELEARWDPRPTLRVFARPRLWVDPLDAGRFRWVPREAWIEARPGPRWSLRAGRQTLTWGSADTYRPGDVLSTRDWGRDFLDPEKQGDWTFTCLYGTAPFGLELVYMPFVEGVTFPSDRSPWSVASAEARLGFGGLPLDEDPLLPRGVGEHSLATRARLTAGRTDFYLTGVSGIDRDPVLTLETAPGGNGAVPRLRPAYAPLRMVGIEVQSALGDVLLKAEATWRDQSVADPAFARRIAGLDPHSVQAVAGIDYLWLGALGGAGDLDVVAEFLYDDAVDGAGLAIYRPFQRDLALALTWGANDLAGTVIEAGWVQDLERAEAVGTLRVRRRIRRAWTAEVGGDLILGPAEPTDPFHIFGPNDRLLARLSYGF
jgi:hypothetical protein